MKVLFLDGSPRFENSNSRYILNGLADKLTSDCDITWANARQSDAEATAAQIAASDTLVIGFPLYVDGIPSHLLAFLEQIQHALLSEDLSTRVYVIVNCGFYEAHQNHIVLQMIKIWCESCGFIWGQGLAAGGGEMVTAAPIGHGPSTNIGKALDQLADSIRQKRTGDVLFTEPNFPRFLYKSAAHRKWYSSSKKNGIKRKELYQQHYFKGVNEQAEDSK